MLLAKNLTGSPVVLSGLSVSVPANGVVNVTSELDGLSGGQFTALETQRPGTIEYIWTQGYAEFSIGSLTASVMATSTAVDVAQTTANNAVPKASVQQGVATLVAGTVTVATANITAGSVIVPIRETPGGTPGDLSIGSPTPGTPGSFAINSTDGGDTSKVRWLVLA